MAAHFRSMRSAWQEHLHCYCTSSGMDVTDMNFTATALELAQLSEGWWARLAKPLGPAAGIKLVTVCWRSQCTIHGIAKQQPLLLLSDVC
jgi:hypothetical protein